MDGATVVGVVDGVTVVDVGVAKEVVITTIGPMDRINDFVQTTPIHTHHHLLLLHNQKRLPLKSHGANFSQFQYQKVFQYVQITLILISTKSKCLLLIKSWKSNFL